MKSILTNWKTTSLGILAILGGIVRFIFALKSGEFTEESVMTTLTTIFGGIGLILAKDSNVTGGTVKQDGGPKPRPDDPPK
jgi:hypothetical protein